MKKTKKILSWLLAAVIVCNASSLSFAAAKRDVNDPVLREIINELSKRLPKFIDKYGETVFVEDEPITRGTLLAAIHEYDRRTKSSGAAETAAPAGNVLQITKQEFDALKAKVTALEKSGGSQAKPSSKSNGSIDMISLIADLEPNMPMLLDNNLKNSKVFKALQQQVAAGSKSAGKDPSYAAVNKEITDMNVKLDQISKRLDSAETNFASASKTSKAQSASAPQKEIDELKNSLNQIQQSYVKLSKRVDDLDKPMLASSGKSSPDAGVDMSYINKQLSDIKKTVSGVPTSAEIKNEINRSKNQTQADIERIERRLNNISTAPRTSSSSGGTTASGSGTKIATVSLGITMIAALFVAR